MKILSVAYPFAEVSKNISGGAEQILFMLDKYYSERNLHSFVIARLGSQINGRLIPFNCNPDIIDDITKAQTHSEYKQLITNAIEKIKPDIIHFHGVDFIDYLPEVNIPVLITLHLPKEYYQDELLANQRNQIFYNCVSFSQQNTFNQITSEVICNGIIVNDFQFKEKKEDYILCLGRICPEKGFDSLLKELHNKNKHIIIAGELFHYPYHLDYYQKEIKPYLTEKVKWIGPASLDQKKKLLSNAKCIAITSTVNETSSLSGMESLSSGTPVIALNRGALSEIISNEETGFIIDDISDFEYAESKLPEISSKKCRLTAEEKYDYKIMAEKYLMLYKKILTND